MALVEAHRVADLSERNLDILMQKPGFAIARMNLADWALRDLGYEEEADAMARRRENVANKLMDIPD